MQEAEERQFEYLDEDERDLIESVENDEWIPVEDAEAVKMRARQSARKTLQRAERSRQQLDTDESSNGGKPSGPMSVRHTGPGPELLDHLTVDFGPHGRDAVEFLRTASVLMSSTEQQNTGTPPRIGETIVYCLREAMKRLLWSQAAPHTLRTKDDVTQDIVETKKRYELCRGLRGSDEQGALEDLLGKIDQLAEIHKDGPIHEPRLIAAIVERTGTHPLSSSDAVEEYLRVIRDLDRGLHHSSSTREARELWAASVGVLRRLFLPPQARIDELDGLAQTAEATGEHVKRARDLITTPTHLSYFLARIQTPTWIEALCQEGIIDLASGESMWPAFGAAKRLSRQHPTEVMKWLTATYVETCRNVECARAIADAALNVGADGPRLVCRIAQKYPSEPIVVHFACEAARRVDASSQVLDRLSDIVLNQTEQSFRREIEEIADRLVQGVDQGNGARRLRLISQKIAAVSTEDLARQRREHTEEGSIATPMDEDGRGDRFEILLSALIGVCRQARRWKGTVDLIGMLGDLPERIAVRVRCWLLGTGEDVGVELLITELVHAISRRRPHGDDLSMIDRVSKETDPAGYVDRWVAALGPAPRVEDVARAIGAGEPREEWWRAYYWVPLVCDEGVPTEWAEVLLLLSAKYGEWTREDLTLQQPSFSHGWARSPYGHDELASVPTMVACRKIADWRPMENQWLVSGLELGRTLEKVVGSKPKEWTEEPLQTALALRHPTYIRHYLKAIGTVLEEGTGVPVEEVVTLLVVARSHPWEAEPIGGHRGVDHDSDWSGVDRAAVGVLKALAVSNRGFGARRDEVWQMLAGEARDRSKPCAIRAGGSDQIDPLQEAGNRPCTQALEAVLVFMEYEFRNVGFVRPDALLLVEETLRLECRDGLQHRAIVARAVGLLLHIAPEWLESRRDLLFGSEAPFELGQKTLDQALKWGKPIRWLLEGFVDGVRDSVSRGVPNALHHFLAGMLLGWRGYSLREAVSFLGYKSSMMARTGGAIARVLRHETKDSEQVDRALKFWKLAIERPGRPEGLEGFGCLAGVAALDDAVWCELTLRTLDRTRGKIDGVIEVAERAAKLSPVPRVLGVMDKLVRGVDGYERYLVVSQAVELLRLSEDMAETDEYQRLKTAVLERGADL